MSSSTLRENVRRNWRDAAPKLAFFGVVFFALLVLVVILFWNRIFINIYPGEAGVIWQRFGGGTELRKIYGEGFHIVPPWDRMYVYNVRVQQVPAQFIALSKDGLSMDFEVSIRYRPQVGSLPVLHQEIGPEYVDTIVKPTVQSEIRSIVGKFKPEEVYGSQSFILETILQGAMLSLDERYVILDDLLIKSVRLPERVQEAIENKQRAEQAALEWNFRIERELKEAQRKEIEGVGIARFQRSVSGEDFKQYLRFKGIDATLALATSHNAKVVMVGGGKDGLPVILNLPEDTPVAQPVSGESTPPGGIDTPAELRPDLSVPHAPDVPSAPQVRFGEEPVPPERVRAQDATGRPTARSTDEAPAETTRPASSSSTNPTSRP